MHEEGGRSSSEGQPANLTRGEGFEEELVAITIINDGPSDLMADDGTEIVRIGENSLQVQHIQECITIMEVIEPVTKRT